MERVALVTGASGFMGSHLLELLRETKDYTLVFATDLVARKEPWNANYFFLADLADKKEARQLIAQVREILKERKILGPVMDNRAFTVFDVKGLFDYSRTYPELHQANVEASMNLYYELLRSGCTARIIVWSAAGIYGDFPEVPARETSPAIPSGNYLTSKWVQEWMALGFGANSPDSLCVSAMRPAGVYGPRSRYGVATSIKLISRGMMGPIRMGHGKNRVSTVHVRDVCGAAIHLSCLPWDSVSGQVYNVADESAYTVAELSRFLGQEVGFPFAPLVHLPFGVMEKMTSDLIKKAKKKRRISMVDNEMSALLKLDALLDISKLKATGWNPKYPDALEGLRDTIAAYRKEGWI